MSEHQSPLVVRPLNFATFQQNMTDRVKEPQMKQGEEYLLIAELQSEEVYEFQVELGSLGEFSYDEVARRGMVLSLRDPEIPQGSYPFFDTIEVDSELGFLTPQNKNHRLYHRHIGHIGFLAKGYLLDSPASFVPLEAGAARTSATEADKDTWTRALALDGILIGND